LPQEIGICRWFPAGPPLVPGRKLSGKTKINKAGALAIRAVIPKAQRAPVLATDRPVEYPVQAALVPSPQA
jgi:hypothetical protein